jgi:hypothetical protein
MVWRIVSFSALYLAGFVASGSAQPVTLPSRLAPETRAALERLIDSARTAGLPVAPLADRAAEGVLKGGDDQRILIAVRTLARELGEARSVLGSATDVTILTATASALHAGASSAELRRLAHPPGSAPDPHTLATAFVTLTDLVAKHISPPAATTAVGELLKRRATDDQFVVLRSEVEQDIRGGVAPETALTKRIRSHVELLDAVPLGPRVINRPPPPL